MSKKWTIFSNETTSNSSIKISSNELNSFFLLLLWQIKLHLLCERTNKLLFHLNRRKHIDENKKRLFSSFPSHTNTTESIIMVDWATRNRLYPPGYQATNIRVRRTTADSSLPFSMPMNKSKNDRERNI